MKKYLIFLFILLYVFPLYSQFSERNLIKGVHAVYGKSSIIRSAPNQQGSIIHILPIGTKIDVIQKASKEEKISEVSDFWYKVVYDKDTGYIWGTLISDNFLDLKFANDTTVGTLLILNLTEDPNISGFKYENSTIEFRIILDGKIIYELKTHTEYSMQIDSIFTDNIKSFTPSINLVRIKYDFNGVLGGHGEQFYNVHDYQIDSLFRVHYMEGEGGFACFRKIISPSDSTGKPNSIILKEKCADVTQCDYINDNPPCNWTYEQDIYLWDGKKLNLQKK